MIKFAIALICLLITAAPAPAQDREIPWLNLEVVVRGDLFRAATIAYEEFSTVLAARAARGEYLATIDKFDIQVSKGPGRYVVWIKPRSSQEEPGFFGGGATYTIDAKTFIVTEKQLSK